MPPNLSDGPVVNELKKRSVGKKTFDKEEKISKVLPKDSQITYATLKQAIPAHCFKPSTAHSLFATVKDLIEVGFYMVLMYYVDLSFSGEFVLGIKSSVAGVIGAPLANFSFFLIRFALWCVYAFICGATMTGVWVIAHECGHGAFSQSQFINDLVGFILHTCLAVPYFSWQYTHASHHLHTNDIDKDEVFVPKSRMCKTKMKKVNFIQDLWRKAWGQLQIVIMLTLGWPIYLATNAGGRLDGAVHSHYDPTSALFGEKGVTPAPKLFILRLKVAASVIGLIAWFGFLSHLCSVYGASLVLSLYLPPLLVTNAFLVSITYLQHTHDDLPHYDHEEWTWLRGALATIDRSMGRYLDKKLHFIHSTHVLHHIFPKVPFYHSEEASKAIIPVLGQYYQKDEGNFFVEFWKTATKCVHLEDSKGIVFWFNETH